MTAKSSILLALILPLSLNTYANEKISNVCKKSNKFFPYKAGVIAAKENAESAFEIFCSLAIKGDYRSQFKIANYYYNGILGYLDESEIDAYVWAKLSISHVKSLKKENFLIKIQQGLSDLDLSKANTIYELAVQLIPSGNRIDGQYEPIDLNAYIKEKTTTTGSRIKGKKSTRSISYIY